MPLYFEKPMGTKDILPERVKETQFTLYQARKLLQAWGYQEIETPIIEYFQTVGLYSQISTEKLIKFLDFSGSTVILRPDLTTPIARFVASTYQDIELPLRLSQLGTVYRTTTKGNFDEIKQLDVELIGSPSLDADGEVITLAAKIILDFAVSGMKITIGHTSFLKVLLKEIGCNLLDYNRLFQALLEKDYVGYRQLVDRLAIIKKHKEYLLQVLKYRGDLETILPALNWFSTGEWQKIFDDLQVLEQILKGYLITDYVNYDLTLVGTQSYYTGLIYNIYCAGHPYPLCTGGRYDNLLACFKRAAPATGFAINLDSLLQVIDTESLKQKQK